MHAGFELQWKLHLGHAGQRQSGGVWILGVITNATAHNLAAPLQCADTSSSATTYNCTTTPSLASLTKGDVVIFTSINQNNSGSATLNVDGIGAVTIKKWQNTANLAAGDLQAGAALELVYDGTYFEAPTVGNAPSGSGSNFYYTSSSTNASIAASSSTGVTTPNDGSTHFYTLVGQVSLSAAGVGTCTSCASTVEVTVTFTDPNDAAPVTEVLTGGTSGSPGTLTLANGSLGTTGLIGQIEAPMMAAGPNTTIQVATVYAASGFGTTNPKYILYFTLEQLK